MSYHKGFVVLLSCIQFPGSATSQVNHFVNILANSKIWHLAMSKNAVLIDLIEEIRL